jgi:hypothetical protein
MSHAKPGPGLPPGIPEVFDGPSAWTGDHLATRQDLWLHTLDAADIAELEHAARGYLATGRDIGEIDAAAFPLPRLGPKLGDLRQTLLSGIGFRVLRGLPVERYDPTTAAAIFCGIGAHLGSRALAERGRATSSAMSATRAPTRPTPGHASTRPPRARPFTPTAPMPWGLLCLREAMEGGDSLLVSVETILNRMRAERPDLLARLFDPIATDRRGEVPEGMKPFMEIPPLSWHGGHLTVFYQRQYIDSAQRFPEAMRLTTAHVEALDMFDALANDPELHLRMRLLPGRYAVRLQPRPAARPHGFPTGPIRRGAATSFGSGCRCPGTALCPRCSGSATAPSRSAIAAGSSRPAPDCMHAPLEDLA